MTVVDAYSSKAGASPVNNVQHGLTLHTLSVVDMPTVRGGGTCSGVGGGGIGVRGHLTYKKRANQVQHKQQVIYSKHAVHLQLLIKSPIAINFKGKKVKTSFVS